MVFQYAILNLRSELATTIHEASKICVINGGVPLHLVAKNNEYELIAVFPPLSLASLNKLTSWNTMVEITNDGQKEVFSAFNLHRYRVKTTND